MTSETPFHCTTETSLKFVPVTVSENPAEPASAEFCESEPNVGNGSSIVNVTAEDVPPPGAGLNTVTEAVAAVRMSAAGTAAINWVALVNVVTSAAPFHWTTEAPTKPEPVTVSEKAAEPAIAEVGSRDVRTGTGSLIVKVTAAEVPPAGAALNTVIEAVPAVAMFIAGTVAVN